MLSFHSVCSHCWPFEKCGYRFFATRCSEPYSSISRLCSLSRPYLEKNGVKYQVASGQTVSVNLVVRDKRVITLLTDAIQQLLIHFGLFVLLQAD